MIVSSAQLQYRGNPIGNAGVGPIGAAMREHFKQFAPQVFDAQKRGASVATDVTRNGFKRVRPIAASRPGRAEESMKSFLNWRAERGTTNVYFDIARADSSAPHWIIQEIGTGEKATIKEAGVKYGPGRPGGTRVRTVRSQVGRPISRRLVWSSGGRYSPANPAGAGQQLQLASRVGAPFRRNSIIIGQEIRGQHFVKRGAEAGFREYQSSVLAAARNAFRKGGTL